MVMDQDDQGLLTPAEASLKVRLSVGALAQLRYLGTGPNYVKLGAKTVRYRRRDLDDWINARVRSGSGVGAGE